MSSVVELLAEHGGLLLLGATVMLGLGTIAARSFPAPVHRQGLGELAVAGTLLWLVLAWVPLPRPDVLHSKWTGAANVVVWEPAQPFTADLQQEANPPARPRGAPTGQEILPGGSRAADPPVVAAASPTHWRPALVAVYLSGGAVCLLWLALGQLVLWCAGRVAVEPAAWLEAVYRSLPVAAELPRPRLLVSRRCRRPVVCGLWRPRILLPDGICRPENTAQLRQVLLHELAHAWRGDAWGHALFSLACPVLYCHPFYWWLRREVRFARELIADDWAARFGTKESYVEQLVSLVRKDCRMVPGAMGVLGVFRFRTPFYRRMKMLIDREELLATKPSRRWQLAVSVACAAVLAATVLLLGLPLAGAGGDAVAAAIDRAGTGESEEAAADAGTAVPPPDEPANEAAPEAAPHLPKNRADAANTTELKVPGLIALIEEFEVAARTEGPVIEMLAKEGMRVKRGQLLAQIDREQAILRVQMAEAGLASLRAEEIRLRSAELELEQAKRQLARLQQLRSNNAVSDSELSDCKTACERAALRAEMAKTEYVASRGVREAELRVAKSALDACRVLATSDGIVLKTYRRVGEWAKPGDPICHIIRLDRLRFEGAFDGRWHDPAEVEDREVIVDVTLARGRKQRVTGKVVFVSPLVGEYGEYQFHAELEKPQRNGRWLLRPGQHAVATVKMD